LSNGIGKEKKFVDNHKQIKSLKSITTFSDAMGLRLEVTPTIILNRETIQTKTKVSSNK